MATTASRKADTAEQKLAEWEAGQIDLDQDQVDFIRVLVALDRIGTDARAGAPWRTSREYVTIAEAAAVLRRTPFALLDAIERGRLVAFRPCPESAYLIRPADLRVYAETPRV
jgi:hypothetical protein